MLMTEIDEIDQNCPMTDRGLSMVQLGLRKITITFRGESYSGEMRSNQAINEINK